MGSSAKELKNNYMTFKQACEYFKKRRQPISKAWIYQIGAKEGFIEGDSHPYLFHKGRMKDYIDRIQKLPKAGWLPVPIAAKKAGTIPMNIYWWIKNGKLETKIAGAGKGSLYVRYKSVKSLVESGRGKNKASSKERTKDEKK